jgi:hypothetical protein
MAVHPSDGIDGVSCWAPLTVNELIELLHPLWQAQSFGKLSDDSPDPLEVDHGAVQLEQALDFATIPITPRGCFV